LGYIRPFVVDRQTYIAGRKCVNGIIVDVCVGRQNISVVRTVTHSAFGGLISSRDFVDLVVNETTPDFISTSGQCPLNSRAVLAAAPRYSRSLGSSAHA